jgi:Flp pilus assembly protein TadG
MRNQPYLPVTAMKTIWTKFCSALRDFRIARGGNVAITFAFATIPVIGAIGAGFDYSHANSVKADLQAALDSTALMLAKDASTTTNADLQTKALNYFTALFNRPNEASINSVSAAYTATGGSQVVVNGSVNVPTTFLRVLGPSSMQNVTVTGSSTTKWGSTRLRVALALDNTGSMADDGKMTALKSATHSLLTQLKNAATTNGDVYVSLIPFSKDVNVGSANYSANWIDWDDWEDANGSNQYVQTCTSTSKRGKSRCTGNYVWVPNNYNTWNGCVTDRDQSFDQTITAPIPSDANLPAASASTLFPAEQYSSCPVAMKGLSYDWTGMSSLVDSMQPNGNTNQPIGLVWAWQSLVGGGPLSAPAMDSNYKYQQVIILMSDGLNTQDRWYSSQSSVDNRMYNSSGNGTCANIKAAGITIYSIQVNTGGDPTSTLMQNCASSSDKFFLVTSSSGLTTVFNQIGTNLTKLRVAK